MTEKFVPIDHSKTRPQVAPGPSAIPIAKVLPARVPVKQKK